MTERWTCLLYHDVVAGQTRPSGGPAHFAVTARGFARQLDLIREQGLLGCAVAHVLESGNRVAISFDDGTAGQYVHAFPALVARGMSATFFVTTSWVGTPGHVSWGQLREMKAAGMSIQSHTHTHPFLSQLAGDTLRSELATSKRMLDTELEQDTDGLALPGGDPPRRALRHELNRQGYRVVATSRWGGNPGTAGVECPRYVRRCTVRGDPSDAHFRRVVTGDRWLAARRGTREAILRALRLSLGPGRYAAWRRRALDVVSRAGRASGAPPGADAS